MAKPLVAIVGRPNVGKSMLFNKLTGQRTSIVEDTPGVTRDRIYGSCEWCGRTFSLVDTGGIEPGTDSEMLKFMRRQAEIGIELADAIIMVVDVHSGVTAADQDVATMLRKSGKPIALAVNKCDSVGPVNPDVYEFYSLGIGDLFETSAIHGHGTGDLLDWVLENIPEDSGEEEDSDVIKVAIVGKPNVGKSSLLNRILGEERVIVSDVAGTTRDAIDSYFENETGKYCFIDTAGMRRKSKVDDAIEKYSNMRSISAIDRADVCLILIDANDGVTEQDTKIAGLVHEAGKAAPFAMLIPARGSCARQGPSHRGQQMGRGGEQGNQHHAGYGGKSPSGPQLHALRPGAVPLRSHRAAGGQALPGHSGRPRPEYQPHHHRRAEQRPGRRHRPGAAAYG